MGIGCERPKPSGLLIATNVENTPKVNTINADNPKETANFFHSFFLARKIQETDNAKIAKNVRMPTKRLRKVG